MYALNKAQIIGNLGADPELRNTTTGQSVCSLNIATNESWTNKEGEKQEKTEWHRAVVWGKPAEIIHQYAKKGHKIYIAGRLQTRTYDKDGQKHYATEIVVDDFILLEGKGKNDGTTADRSSGRPQEKTSQATPPIADDDIPF